MVLLGILNRPPVGRVTELIGLFGLRAREMAWSLFGLISHPTRHWKPRGRLWQKRLFFSFRGNWSRDGFHGQEFWSMTTTRPSYALQRAGAIPQPLSSATRCKEWLT